MQSDAASEEVDDGGGVGVNGRSGDVGVPKVCRGEWTESIEASSHTAADCAASVGLTAAGASAGTAGAAGAAARRSGRTHATAAAKYEAQDDQGRPSREIRVGPHPTIVVEKYRRNSLI